MNRPTCSETQHVEPAHDGHLSSERAARFRAHLPHCAECSRATARLARLRAELRGLPFAEPPTEAVAATRRNLLASVRGSSTRIQTRPWTLRTTVFGLAAAAAVAMGASWQSQPRYATAPPSSAVSQRAGASEPGSPAAAPAEPSLSVEVEATPGTRWSRNGAGTLESIDLVEGELQVTVRHRGSTGRVLVTLPDGELEDIGTTFVVTAANGHTQRVSVSEGAVVLRLRSQPTLNIGAGESFRAARLEPSNEPAVVGTPGSAAPALACPAASFYDSGLEAFRGGRYDTAVNDLRRFSRECRRDRRAEDAAYLTMVALARAGRASEASAAARAYLSRFPSGFRRKEAEQRLQDSE